MLANGAVSMSQLSFPKFLLLTNGTVSVFQLSFSKFFLLTTGAVRVSLVSVLNVLMLMNGTVSVLQLSFVKVFLLTHGTVSVLQLSFRNRVKEDYVMCWQLRTLSTSGGVASQDMVAEQMQVQIGSACTGLVSRKSGRRQGDKSNVSFLQFLQCKTALL